MSATQQAAREWTELGPPQVECSKGWHEPIQRLQT